MTDTITILGIAGSLRHDAYNRAALRGARRLHALVEHCPTSGGALFERGTLPGVAESPGLENRLGGFSSLSRP